MTEQLLYSLLSKPPDTRERSYVFITRNKNLAQNIVGAGYFSVLINENEGYISDCLALEKALSKRELAGCRSKYTYIPCLTKVENQQLIEYFDQELLEYLDDGWKAFQKADYLKIKHVPDKAKKIIDDYIRRYQVEDDDKQPEKEIKLGIPAGDLFDMDIPPLKWIIDELLPEGVCFFHALPKYKKSFLCMDIALCVADGKPFLGYQTTQMPVLYMDFESGHRRPRERATKLSGGKRPTNNLIIVDKSHNVGRINETDKRKIEFFQFLDKQLEAFPGIGLIIIDVFRYVRQPPIKNKSIYERDSEDMGALVSYAEKHKISMIVIHHNAKGNRDYDPTLQSSGSTGLTGATDTDWDLRKEKRFADDTIFSITGRDIREKELVIYFNEQTLHWELQGTAQEVKDNNLTKKYHASPIIATIKKLVSQSDGEPKEWKGTASDLISASKYLGNQIYDKPQQVGSAISEFEMLLSMEGGISFENDRNKSGGQKREYRFFDNGWNLSG